MQAEVVKGLVEMPQFESEKENEGNCAARARYYFVILYCYYTIDAIYAMLTQRENLSSF